MWQFEYNPRPQFYCSRNSNECKKWWEICAWLLSCANQVMIKHLSSLHLRCWFQGDQHEVIKKNMKVMHVIHACLLRCFPCGFCRGGEMAFSHLENVTMWEKARSWDAKMGILWMSQGRVLCAVWWNPVQGLPLPLSPLVALRGKMPFHHVTAGLLYKGELPEQLSVWGQWQWPVGQHLCRGAQGWVPASIGISYEVLQCPYTYTANPV